MTIGPRRDDRDEPVIGDYDDYDDQFDDTPLIIDDDVAGEGPDDGYIDFADHDDGGYVIGDPAPTGRSTVVSRAPAPAPVVDDWDEEDDYDDQWSEYEDDAYEEPYYDERRYRRGGYDGGSGGGGRIAIIVGVVVLAAILGGALLWFGIAALTGDDDGGATVGGTGDAQFDIALDQPLDGDRINLDEPFEVVARAISTEAITTFTLYLDGEPVDDFTVLQPRAEKEEEAKFRISLRERGNHELQVEVKTKEGSSQRSDTITVVGVEPVTGTPGTITGRVVADLTARRAPQDTAEEVGRLTAGETVTVVGRTRNNEWLKVDASAGRGIWVRRDGIELQESVNRVPIAETETATPTPTESPTPTASPTPTTQVDLMPTGGELSDGGSSLIVYISNAGGEAYAGPLVVTASGLPGGSEVRTFDVSVGPGEGTWVVFNLSYTVTTQTTVEVTVDSNDAVAESSEGNNYAAFVVEPVAIPASLSVARAALDGDTIVVVVSNDGAGTLEASEVTVAIALDGSESRRSQTLALEPGATADFFVPAPPGSGTATVTLFVNGSSVYTAEVTIPGDTGTDTPTEAETDE